MKKQPKKPQSKTKRNVKGEVDSKKKKKRSDQEKKYREEWKVPKRIRDQVGKAKAKFFEQACAYVIESPYFPPLGIKKSANAWWLDPGKVHYLLDAFRYDATVIEACVEAGISEDQYYYFIDNHPDFSRVKEALQSLPNITAKKTLLKAIGSDPKFALKWLRNRQNDRFNTREKIDSHVHEVFKGGVNVSVEALTDEDIEKMK